ncbi:MAG TPA: hypothetical protein VHU85_17625 [Acidimicrobiales bacterium]|jgi:hypothetical protein|nr:hypothetical protein [Acidimicrobiales bacterium]
MNEDQQLDAISRLHGLFGRQDLDYWLFGGWAVDFHAGRVTRQHADIDMAVWVADLDRAKEVLDREGWILSRDALQDGYAEFGNQSMHLDLTYLARDETTGAVYTPLAQGRGAWPDGTFGEDLKELNGVQSHVVSLGSLIADKSELRGDPSTASKDRADVVVLVSLPSDR